jgi:hypothetical protein
MKLMSQLKNGGQLIQQRLRQLAHVGRVLERRHFQIEHQQRHSDREDAVAERLDAGQA